MKLRSDAFQEGQPIPKKYTGEGEDVPPPLTWQEVPNSAKELVLICDDPDAPTPEPFVHWVLYGVKPGDGGIPEGGLPAQREAKTGMNSFKNEGYGGPMPPPGHGTHHYHFKLYALDQPINLPEGADRSAVDRAMAGHVIEDCELVGTYER